MGQDLTSCRPSGGVQGQEGDEEFVARGCQERKLGTNDGAHVLLCPR